MKRVSVAALLVLAGGLTATAQNRGQSSNSQAPTRSFSSTTSTSNSGNSAPAAMRGRGVPASVTSQTPSRTFLSVPAGVTSFGNNVPPQCASTGIFPLIPSAMGCTDSRFTGGAVNLQPQFSQYYPIYVPYAYPVAVEEQPAAQDVQVTEPPALTIFEHRASVASAGPASNAKDGAPKARALQQSGPAKPEREQTPTVLIFRDGHKSEVLNYAIVGQTLYDLGTFVAYKIPLSDLNLKATIKANEERGIDFSVPVSVKLD